MEPELLYKKPLSNDNSVLHILKENHSNFHLWGKRTTQCQHSIFIDAIAFQLNVISSKVAYYSDCRLEFLQADLPFCSQIRTSHWPMCWRWWSAKQEGGRPIRRRHNNPGQKWLGLGLWQRSEPGDILKVKLTCFTGGLMWFKEKGGRRR